MPLSTIGWKLPSLLRLLIAALSLETVSQHGTSKGASQRRERARFLSPDNLNDVKEFRTRLQRADLDLAKFLLGIVEALLEFKRGSEDPQKVEENRMHLETIEKGEYREGRGWIWNGHLVPEPQSRRDFFERRTRIIRNGVWNPTRRGWEYQGEFFGVWDH